MRSFFELETPDFAWKFVRTVRIKYKTYKKFLISTKVQSTQTSAILELQTSDFAKIKKCKIQKNKKSKNEKNIKNTTIQKTLGFQLLVQKCKREQNIKRAKTAKQQKIEEKALALAISHRIFRSFIGILQNIWGVCYFALRTSYQ